MKKWKCTKMYVAQKGVGGEKHNIIQSPIDVRSLMTCFKPIQMNNDNFSTVLKMRKASAKYVNIFIKFLL